MLFCSFVHASTMNENELKSDHSVCIYFFLKNLLMEPPKRLQLQPQCFSARYRLSAEPLKFPLASPRVGGPCEMVPMCCRALTEWNMSAQCHRQQASCLVISLPCSTGAAFRIGGIFLPQLDQRPGLDVCIMCLDLSQHHVYG